MKIAPPNYTQTPNIFFDEIMKTLKKFIPVTGGSPPSDRRVTGPVTGGSPTKETNTKETIQKKQQQATAAVSSKSSSKEQPSPKISAEEIK